MNHLHTHTFRGYILHHTSSVTQYNQYTVYTTIESYLNKSFHHRLHRTASPHMYHSIRSYNKSNTLQSNQVNHAQQHNNSNQQNTSNDTDQQSSKPLPEPNSIFSISFVLRCIRYVLYGYIIRVTLIDVMPCMGQSMEPTINSSGEYLFINKLCIWYNYINLHVPITYNDVIIIQSPLEPNRYMSKRVIGKSGDIVRLGLSTNDIYIDIVIPKHYIFVLGDNQLHSIDSRMFGPIHQNKSLYGKVICAVNKYGIHSVEKRINSGINDIQSTYITDVNQIDSDGVVMRAERSDQIAMLFDTINERRKSQLFVKHVFIADQPDNTK